MSRLTRQDVHGVAVLARLSFSDDEADALAGQLSHILDYVDQLRALDTEGVEPMAHPLALTNVLRDDTRAASLAHDDALANAPEREAGCFRVPPIIQES